MGQSRKVSQFQGPALLPTRHTAYVILILCMLLPQKSMRSWASCISAKATEGNGDDVNFGVT